MNCAVDECSAASGEGGGLVLRRATDAVAPTQKLQAQHSDPKHSRLAQPPGTQFITQHTLSKLMVTFFPMLPTLSAQLNWRYIHC
jgi:hypothetical protein